MSVCNKNQFTEDGNRSNSRNIVYCRYLKQYPVANVILNIMNQLPHTFREYFVGYLNSSKHVPMRCVYYNVW